MPSSVISVPACAGGTAEFPMDSLYRISTRQYHKMIEKGIFGEDDQVELLEGVLAAKYRTDPSAARSNGSGKWHVGELFRISLHKYHEMIKAGIFDEDERVELLEGILVSKMPKNPPHIVRLGLLNDLLLAILSIQWFINIQDPVLAIDSEPEPDLSIIRGKRRDFSTRKPRSEDVSLIVEVSDSSLLSDRYKKRLYARAGYVIYWIINIPDQQIEVYSHPNGNAEQPDYAEMNFYHLGDFVPLVLDGEEIGKIAAADVFA